MAGWGGPETPFASSDAFQDFVGRYQEAGMQRFVFSFGSEAFPSPYREWVAAGAWGSRDSLEAFALKEMGVKRDIG